MSKPAWKVALEEKEQREKERELELKRQKEEKLRNLKSELGPSDHHVCYLLNFGFVLSNPFNSSKKKSLSLNSVSLMNAADLLLRRKEYPKLLRLEASNFNLKLRNQLKRK